VVGRVSGSPEQSFGYLGEFCQCVVRKETDEKPKSGASGIS